MKKIILIVILGITFFTTQKVFADEYPLTFNGLRLVSCGSMPTPSGVVYYTENTSKGSHDGVAFGSQSGSVCDFDFTSAGNGWIEVLNSYSDYGYAYKNGSTISYASSTATTTRFIFLTPEIATTTATTTTIGAEIYINSTDYEEGMYLSMSFTNQTLSLTGGSVLDAYNSASGQGLEIHIPLTSGYNNVSTTTTFLYAGRTDGKYTVETDSFLSSLPLFGDFFNPNTLISSTTYFYIGFKSGLDNAVDLGASSVSQYILTGTTTGANTILECSNLLSGGITPCIVSLFIPNATTFSDDLTRLRNGFLAVWPLGYVTRFIEILVTTSTSSLPTIAYTTGADSMFGEMNINFDPFGTLLASTSPINYVSDNAEDPQTIWEIMEEPITIVVYLMLLFMIIHDLTGVKKHDTGGDGEPIQLSYKEQVWFRNNKRGGYISPAGRRMIERGKKFKK